MMHMSATLNIVIGIGFALAFGFGGTTAEAAEAEEAAVRSEATTSQPSPETRAVSSGESKYRIALDKRESRLSLALYGQLAQFSGTTESLMGAAFEASATYALQNHIAAVVALNQAMSMGGSISILYTGLRSAISYAVQGEFIAANSLLQINDKPTLEFKTPDHPLMAVDVGIDQYFFNGVARIVPATGISSTLRYDRTLWDLRFSTTVRAGLLVISEAQVPMVSVGIGMPFNF